MKKQKIVRAGFHPCPSKKQKGITLIALVITVIVLLILAGVSLRLIAGGDGIINKAEKATGKYTQAAAKEKLELKMVEYIADKIDNPDLSLKDYLQSVEGSTDVREDDSDDNPGGYIVNVDGFEFKVSANGEVLGTLEKTTSPQIDIALDAKKVTITITQRGERIEKLEILDSDGNVLTNIGRENMTQTEGKYVVEYTFADQGNYSIVVTTANGEKYTKEIVIDLNPPAQPVITSNYGYPILTKTGVKLDGTTKIEYDTTTETEDFYSLDGVNWQKYTGEFQATAGTIYAKSVKKSNGLEATISKEIGIPDDALSPAGYDGNDSTSGGAGWIEVDSNMIGRKVRVFILAESPSFGVYNSNKECILSLGAYRQCEYIFEIPEGTKYIKGSYSYPIYEIGPSCFAQDPVISWNITGQYLLLTEAGVRNGHNDVTITYDQETVEKLYSLDGANWQDYQNKAIQVDYGRTIYAKGVDENGKETGIVSASSVLPNDAIGLEACDGDEETATRLGVQGQYYIEVDPSMCGKNVFLKVKSTSWAGSWGRLEFILNDGSKQEGFTYRDLDSQPFIGELTIPENTTQICIDKQASVGIYEIKPVNE